MQTMRLWKMWLSMLILVALSVSNLTIIALAENADYIVVDIQRDTQSVIVNGHFDPVRANQRVVLEVFKPNKTIGDIDYSNQQTVNASLSNIDITTVKEDGSFAFGFPINGEDGVYNIKVKGIGMAQPLVSTFTYYSSNSINSLYSEITTLLDLSSAMSESQRITKLKELLESFTNRDMLGFTFGLYNELEAQNVDFTPVYSMLINYKQNVSSMNELNTRIKKAVVTFAMNIAETTQRIEQLIADNSALLELDGSSVFGVYNSLTADKNTICQDLLKKNFTSDVSMLNVFKEKTIIMAVFRTQYYMDLKAVLTDHKATLGLDLTAFNNLDANEKQPKVLQAVANQNQNSPYSSAIVLKTVFDNAVAEQSKPVTNDTGAGGNNSSHASGGSAVITVVTPVPTATPVQTPPPSTYFTDIQEYGWATESINTLAKQEIIIGNGGLFRPGDYVKREEFVKMVIKALNLADKSRVVDFTDVKSDQWYYEYIASAKGLGIINGADDNTFGVGRYITRQEMAAISFRALKSVQPNLVFDERPLEFNDSSDIGTYAVLAIGAMKQISIINGKDNGMFAPKDNTTRAEAAKIIYELLKFIKAN